MWRYGELIVQRNVSDEEAHDGDNEDTEIH
jgi:hypothetical protein